MIEDVLKEHLPSNSNIRWFNSTTLENHALKFIKEYDLTPSAFDEWLSRINSFGSTKEADNRTPEELEFIILRKENQNWRWELLL